MGEPKPSETAPLRHRKLAEFCRAAGKDVLFYLIPAVGLSLLILRLTKGALWMPHEWRYWVLGLGLSAGLACYRYSLGFRDRYAPIPPAPAGRVSQVKLAEYQKEVKELETQRDQAAWRQAVVWFMALIVAVGFQVGGLNPLVYPWGPPYETVQLMFFSHSQVEIPAVFAPDQVFDGPCYLEWDKTDAGQRIQMTGSFLFPIWLVGSDSLTPLIEETEATIGPRGSRAERQFLLDNAPLDLKEFIVDDHGMSLGITKFLFVVVHLMIMISASMAYGLTFNLRDEVSSWLSGLF